MRLSEIKNRNARTRSGITDTRLSSNTGLKTYQLKVKLKQLGYINIIDTTVQARTPEMARRIIRAQYNDTNVIVGQPREIK